MKFTSVPTQPTGLSRLKLFLALSRTRHGLLDMATPPLAALFWLGAFPPLKVIMMGLLTVFAGYTAVYALNDVIDYPVDKMKLQKGVGLGDADDYLDILSVRHPMAHGFLSFEEGVLWVVAWGCLALVGALLLNPVCAIIFGGGCVLETVYCLMWKTSHFRTIVSGVVKTSGGIAAVFAVDHHPSPTFLVVLFLWLFFWEIGGQNIPNDWIDIGEDKRLQAQTVPARFGPGFTSTLILGCLILVVLLNIAVLQLSPRSFELHHAALSLLVGVYLLIAPAYRLYKSKERLHALALFNRASYYPLAVLVLVTIRMVI